MLFRPQVSPTAATGRLEEFLEPGIRGGWEARVLIVLAAVVAACCLAVNVSLDVNLAGVLRPIASGMAVVADRDGVLTYVASERNAVTASAGLHVASIRSLDPVALRRAPNLDFSRQELEARRERLMARQSALAQSLEDGRASLASMARAVNALIETSRNQLTQYTAEVDRLTQRQTEQSAMLGNGLILQATLDATTRELVDKRFQVGELLSRITDDTRKLDELAFQERELTDASSRESFDIDNQLADVETALETDSDIAAIDIAAESDGVLVPRGYATGQVVKAGDVLFDVIVPGTRYEVETDIPSDQLGDLRPGLEATIAFPAYPAYSHGTIDGTLKFVSQVPKGTMAYNETLDLRQAFRAIIEPDTAQMAAFFQSNPAVPGMAVEVHIKKQSVPIWRLMLAPLLNLSHRLST